MRRVYLAIAIVIAAILLYLAIRDVSWQEMLVTLRQADPRYLVVLFLIGSINLFIRAQRWGVLVRAESPVSPLTMFWSTAVGYLGNTYLPARAGEVIRSVLLGQKTGIAKTYILATAITERIFDVLILVLIGVLSVSSIGDLPDWLPSSMRVMGGIGAAAILVLLLLPRMGDLAVRWIHRLPIPPALREKAERLVRDFLLGAQAFIHFGRALSFLGLSALIWCLDATEVLLLSRSLNLDFSYPQSFLLLVALGLSSAIPSTPGFVGVFQFVAVTLLPLFGVSRSQALTYILAFQAIGIVSVTFWGLVGLWRSNHGSFRGLRPNDPSLV